MSIKNKLIIIPFLALLGLLGVIIFSWQSQQQLIQTIHRASLFEQQAMHLQKLLRGVNESLLTASSFESVQFAQQGKQGFEHTLALLLQAYQAESNHTRILLTEQVVPLWQIIETELEPYLQEGGVADEPSDQIMMKYGHILARSDQLSLILQELAQTEQVFANKTSEYLLLMNISVGLIFLVILALVFYHFYRTIAKPIDQMRTIVQQLPATDLQIANIIDCQQQLQAAFQFIPSIKTVHTNEVNALVQAINFMLDTIRCDMQGQTIAKQALTHSRAMLQLVIDHIPEFIYWKNAQGQYQGCSLNYAGLLGLKNPEQLIDKTDQELNWPQGVGEQYHQQDIAVLANGQTILHQLKKRTLNNELIQWLDISQIPLRNEDNQLIGLLVCHEDITERRRIELEREEALTALQEERSLLARRVEERTAELSRANAELGRASRLKDEFLANMSHELRTPLNAILGIAEVLQEGVYGSINEQQKRSLIILEESGRHLLSLINDILDLAKVEAGKMGLECQLVNLKSVCESCLRIVKEIAIKKQLSLMFNFDDQINVINADERRLKQIIVNLLSNAVKFTPSGGKVSLITCGDANAGVVHISIEDTGIGISEENIKRLFHPFEQLDSGLSRTHEGTGLGLSLAYRLVEMHNGSISVSSQLNQGSRFNISLPWNTKDEQECLSYQRAALETTQTLVANGKEKTQSKQQPLVLIVEDNPSNVETLSDYLASHNYDILVAWNGEEAIEKASTVYPDIILMDIQMPVLDGLEATRILRNQENTKHIPIIALTALAMPNDRERCLAVGANEYLSKPVSFRKLIVAMNQLLKLT